MSDAKPDRIQPPGRHTLMTVQIQETITYLEMTAPEQLRAGRPAPAPIQLQRSHPAEFALVRSVHARIGAPHHWSGRRAWTDQQWRQ